MVSLGGARYGYRQLIRPQHFFSCNLPRPTQNPDTSSSVLRILCKQIDSPDQFLMCNASKKHAYRIFRFGISSLSPQILTLPQLPCNPKGSSPYNFRFRLPHAGESHLPHVSQSPSSPSLLSDPGSQFSLRLPHQTRIPEG